MTQNRLKKIQLLVQTRYKDEEGQPLLLSEGQAEIFDIIFSRKYPRVHLMASTRYGKSLTVALAVLTRITTFSEKWAIIAPNEAKARIIMGYIIQHIFDNEFCKRKFDVGKDESLERIRREKSKQRINFRHLDGTLGEVYILSADSRNKQSAGESLLGFGSSNVVQDEASLIDDDIESKIFRMLGDSVDNFYLKIGNPFRRNHFFESSKDPKYFKMNIPYQQGIEEGRISQDFIDEAKKKPNFDVLYENKFPEADAIDAKGWSNLILDKEFENALTIIEPEAWLGERMLGVDVARGGGNYNVWTLRTRNYAKILGKNQDGDLMSVAGTTILLMNANNINQRNVFIDDIGVGSGVCDRLRELGYRINPVRVGDTADDRLRFFNRRAENYWKIKEWLNLGGKLCKNDDWKELLQIKYKAHDSRGVLQIMPKEEMRRYGIESPDVADSLMLTFDRNPYNPERELFEKKQNESFDKFAGI